MITKNERIIKKFEDLSLKYHKLSLLFNELSGSLKIKSKEIGIHNNKKFKEYLKTLNLDYDKIYKLSNTLENIKYEDLKGDKK